MIKRYSTNCSWLLITLVFVATMMGSGALSAQTAIPDSEAVIRSQREDGRFIASYQIAHQLLKQVRPKYAYKQGMTTDEFAEWQANVSRAMEELMHFPEFDSVPTPRCISSEQREGYSIEKWEFYPLPSAVSTFLVLKPAEVKTSAPAVLCIPGSGRTKEGLAGERGVCDRLTEDIDNPHTTMALQYVKAGYVAVAVDNACAGESADLIEYPGVGYDYDTTSRIFLEMGWSWLGYTSYLNKQVLDWMKLQPCIDRKRIAVSGFSLGTEPMMVLGCMDKEICAFVYNDFLCNTLERAIVATKPNERGVRRFPNSIRHLIPNYWHYFNFPDVVASLAPRPIIFTEGGLDRDFNLVKDAYQVAGNPQAVSCHHYPKYADPDSREIKGDIPEGIDYPTYFHLANVDTKSHYFKFHLAIPWLDRWMK